MEIFYEVSIDISFWRYRQALTVGAWGKFGEFSELCMHDLSKLFSHSHYSVSFQFADVGSHSQLSIE